MHRSPAARARRSAARLLLTAAVSLAVLGCAGPPEQPDTPAKAKSADPPTPRTQPQGDTAGDQQSTNDTGVTGNIAEHARRLKQAMQQAEPPADQTDPSTATQPAATQPRRSVQWIERQPNPSQPQPDPREAASGANRAASTADPTEAQPTPQKHPAVDAEAVKAEMSRDELLDTLLKRVRTAGEGSVIQRALTTATLSAIKDDGKLSNSVLAPLADDQRRRVERYVKIVRAMRGNLAESDSDTGRAALHQRIDALFGDEPISIRKLVLCREVSGYGVYQPFADHTFLADQSHRMIIYVELDHFTTKKQQQSDRYEVNLEQHIVLYNESDGLAVWRHEPVQIKDVSRNQRRDFFLVQLITLPKRLSVGKYRLKVRVTDEHGGSIDETTVPVRLVADDKLLNGNNTDK